MTDSTPTNTPTESGNNITPAAPVRVNDRSNSITVSAADLVPQRSGILATAVDEAGTPARELKETTRVTIGGVQMPLRAAVINGFIVKDEETGDYREPTADEQTSRQDTTEKAQTEQVTLPDQVSEENLDQIVRAVQHYGGNPDTLVADFLTDPSKPPKAFAEISRRYGTAHSALNEAWAGIVLSAADQADGVVKEMGLNPDEVFEWAMKRNKTAYNGAVMRHFRGSLEGYRQLARDFMKARGFGEGPGVRRSTPGVTVLEEKSGVVTVRMPSGKLAQFSSANARAQGLL